MMYNGLDLTNLKTILLGRDSLRFSDSSDPIMIMKSE